MTSNVSGQEVFCKRVGCKYKWFYKGSSKFYACCPRCRGTVKILNVEVKK